MQMIQKKPYFPLFQDIASENDLISSDESDVGAYVAVVTSNEISTYYVIVEKRVMQRNLKKFCEAVMVAFVYHYIFNLQYFAPLTYEFIQRALVQIGCHDRKPTPKVATLLNYLNKI
jgi:hypothetical protein